MLPTDSARSALRSATAPHHERVDRLFSYLDLADRGSYGRFLAAQATAFLPAEAALEAAGAAAVVPDWAERRRADLLRADLVALGLPIPAGDAAIRFDGPAAVLGGVYVLEGSRLGGRLLRRQVAPGSPTGFLDAGASWPRLLAILEQRLTTPDQRAVATAAAIRTFALFEAGALRLGPG